MVLSRSFKFPVWYDAAPASLKFHFNYFCHRGWDVYISFLAAYFYISILGVVSMSCEELGLISHHSIWRVATSVEHIVMSKRTWNVREQRISSRVTQVRRFWL
jgi:hypothetical protein